MSARIAYYFFICLLLTHFSTYSCSIEHRSTKDYFHAASDVFYARIISTELVGAPKITNLWVSNKIRIRFIVLENFKGLYQSTGEFVSGFRGTPCLMEFKVGAEYLIFKTDSDAISIVNGSLQISNRSYSSVKKLLKKIRLISTGEY